MQTITIMSFLERAPLRGDWKEDACGSKSPRLQQFLFFNVMIKCKVVGRFLSGQPVYLRKKTLAAPPFRTHPR
jgi:hypothetical protein